MDRENPTQVKMKKKTYPSIFKKDAWLVDNEIKHKLEIGKIHCHRQYEVAILTFTEEPRGGKWGTLLSKVVQAIKDDGEIYFPSRLSDKFLIIGSVPQKGQNAENFLHIKVHH